MSSVDETAQAMFSLGKFNPVQLFQTVREVKSVVDMLKGMGNRSDLTVNGDIPNKPNFTGQHTDIAFTAENGKLNENVINSINDDSLRKNVQDTFNDAVKDGYLNYNDSTGEYVLTQKGNEHINSEQFIRQFERDQLNKISDNKAYVNLKGNSSDLGVFRYTDSINLNHLAHSDPAAFKRLQSYFYECQKYDFVDIAPDGTIIPTEKCKTYLNNSNEKIDIFKLNKNNIKDFEKSMRSTYGHSAAEASKEAVKEAASKVSKEAAKKSAAASAGAATGGVATAATVCVDLSAKGADALTKLETQNRQIKSNNR